MDQFFPYNISWSNHSRPIQNLDHIFVFFEYEIVWLHCLKLFTPQGISCSFYTVNLRFLFWTKRSLQRWGSNCWSGRGVVSNYLCFDIPNKRRYQGYVCHVSVIIIICPTFSWKTLFRIWYIILRGGKAYGNILFQHCCIASVDIRKQIFCRISRMFSCFETYLDGVPVWRIPGLMKLSICFDIQLAW